MESKQTIAGEGIHKLGNRIRRRIFNIWFLKYELPLLAGEIILVFVAVFLIARFVFVEKVVSNAFLITVENPWRLFLFLGSSFMSAHFMVKAAVILLFAAGLLILKDINKSMVTYLLMHRKRFSRPS